jgi:NodT family efflux transporter outer membrane factor (OMF) lipoprotein
VWPKAFVLVLLLLAGCTSFPDWIHNGFKVGPNYGKPPVPVAEQWIAAKDRRVHDGQADHSAWWCAFGDPLLNALVDSAYAQNLTVRQAGFRVLEARALRAIAAGNLFPQQQQAAAGYSSQEISRKIVNNANLPARFFSIWDGGFNLAWEIDFWGRFRRALESADATLDSAVESYDDVLVTLVADVASTYVTIRTLQMRIDLAEKNAENQKFIVNILEDRFTKGAKNTEFDYPQHKANYEATKALVWQLEIDLQQAENQLCVLQGIPPRDLEKDLGKGRIPRVPAPDDPNEWNQDLIVGIPAAMLLRRPDVRRAERDLAAQSALIGVATAELYPHIALTGTIGLASSQLRDLFNTKAWAGTIGPSLTWNILNYGRLLSNIRVQDARFQNLAVAYQQTVLKANQEAENAMVEFLKVQPRYRELLASAQDADLANQRMKSAFKDGREVSFNQWFNVAVLKRQQEDQAAEAAGEIALSLIQLYRALGGGWQIRMGARCESPNVQAGGGFSKLPPNGAIPDNKPPVWNSVTPSPTSSQVDAPARSVSEPSRRAVLGKPEVGNP